MKTPAETLCLVRGGGDLATGVIFRLHHAGFPIVVTELENPLVVRRTVSAANAVFEGSIQVEGMHVQVSGTVEEAVAKRSDLFPGGWLGNRVCSVGYALRLPFAQTPSSDD